MLRYEIYHFLESLRKLTVALYNVDTLRQSPNDPLEFRPD